MPFVEDLGSGAVVATEKLAPVEHEPTPAEALKRGVDLVCFSGNKLLGGPQAGIIAGKAKLIAALKREPFFRALRCDKLILSALQTTVDDYLYGVPASAGPGDTLKRGHPTPVLEMLAVSNDELRARAEKIVAALVGLPLDARIAEGKAQIGGGTLPRSVIPSVTVDFVPTNIGLADFAARLRASTPPVIGYISGNRFKLDLRTIFPRQDEQIAGALSSVLTGDLNDTTRNRPSVRPVDPQCSKA